MVLSALANGAGASTARTPRTSPTGDAATIALYTRVVANMNSLSHLVEVTHHFDWMGYTRNRWVLSWGTPKAVYTYQVAVDDTTVARVSKGVTSWTTDTYATPCRTSTPCHSTIEPLRMYAGRSGDFWALLSGKGQSVKCWNKAVGTEAWIAQDYSVGTPLWYAGSSPYTTNPHYLPMVKKGHLIAVTSTYQYKDSHRGVVEVDTINTTTHRFTHSSITVFKGARKDEAAYSYSFTVAVPASLPTPPALHLCA